MSINFFFAFLNIPYTVSDPPQPPLMHWPVRNLYSALPIGLKPYLDLLATILLACFFVRADMCDENKKAGFYFTKPKRNHLLTLRFSIYKINISKKGFFPALLHLNVHIYS
jgi:hypothetical protein